MRLNFTVADQDAWMACLDDITPSRYEADPVGWTRDVLGEHLWSKQREILQSLQDHRYTAVQSCHGAGKSFVTSRAVSWWLSTKPLGSAFAVTTAPTAPQVSAILWREIKRAHKKGNLQGYVTQGSVPAWKLADGEIIGYGRKPADYDQSAFNGIHSRYPIIAIDEACGVPKSLFDAVDSLATNEDARVIAIGNPDDPSSHFEKICRPGSGWNVIRIDGLESPLFTEEAVARFPRLAELMESSGIPYSTEEIPPDLAAMLVSPMWVAERIDRWGVTSPIFAAKVRGLFPDIGEDILITPKMIREAQERSLTPINYKILGVDVARFGSDRTVLATRSGPVVRIISDFAKQDTVQVTEHVINAATRTRADEIRIDGVGIGGGVVDQLSAKGHEVIDMQAGSSPEGIDAHLFANARAEWYWSLHDRFENGLIDIDPDDDELAAQLGSLRYKYDNKGRILIESKSDMKSRGLPSPDRADAVMLTSPVAELGNAYEDPQLTQYSISPV
jgi:hypothetical protein